MAATRSVYRPAPAPDQADGLYYFAFWTAKDALFSISSWSQWNCCFTGYSGWIENRNRTGRNIPFLCLCSVLWACFFTYIHSSDSTPAAFEPTGFGPLSPDLAFNTAASFTTNTNWQSYGGESTMSYFSQMVGLAFHNFVSAAVGLLSPPPWYEALPAIPPRPSVTSGWT